MAKNYSDDHKILHKCQKMQSSDHVVMHIDNGDIKVHFWIVILLYVQQDAIRFQTLVCNTNARAGTLFGKDAFI